MPEIVRDALNKIDLAARDIERRLGLPAINYFTVWNAALGNTEARAHLRAEAPKAVRFGVKLAAAAIVGRTAGVTRFLATNTSLHLAEPLLSREGLDLGLLRR
jgi:hypothetical protein